MAKGALALAALLFLLPLVSANVGQQTTPPAVLSYRCAAQGASWQYLHGDISGTVDAKYDEAANNQEIMQNEDVCWQSGMEITVTPTAGGLFAIDPGTWRAYLGHPPVAWLPETDQLDGVPIYSTATTYDSPLICRVSGAAAGTLNGFLTTLYAAPVTYIKQTNIGPEFYNPPNACVPPKWCYCTDEPNNLIGLWDYTGALVQGPRPATAPPLWKTCQQGAMTGVVVCKGDVRIYETTTGVDVLKATIPMEGNGAQAQINLASKNIALSSPGVKKFRTDLYIKQCGVYTRSDLGTFRFYKDSYPLAENILLQGTELTFNAQDCAAPAECKLSIAGDETPQVNCDNPVSVTLDYKDLVAANQNSRIDCDSVLPAEYNFNQLSGTSTGYAGGTEAPASGSCTLSGVGLHTVTGYVKSGATDVPCPMDVACTSAFPTCQVVKDSEGSDNVIAHIEYQNAEPDTEAQLFCDGDYSNPDEVWSPVSGTGLTAPPYQCSYPASSLYEITGQLSWIDMSGPLPKAGLVQCTSLQGTLGQPSQDALCEEYI
ncbi:MAG: hypothetical protein Q7T16_04680 [Candidatus Burarchaeum sp.]|nr:hypothetical protein [Candidatus Burarchaeum sp.]MDO8339924.1 hypothetical protein [Candidatus Burarchaeum sp.]